MRTPHPPRCPSYMETVSEPGNEAPRESGSACRKLWHLSLMLLHNPEAENRRKSPILQTCRRLRGALGPAEDCSKLGTFVDGRFAYLACMFLEALLIVYRSKIRWFLNGQIYRSSCIGAPNVSSDCVYPPCTPDWHFRRFWRIGRNVK